MFDYIKRYIAIPCMILASALQAQDVIEITNKRVVKEGETLTIREGSTVKMGSGATLEVRGSLIIQGTKSNPVRFQSMDPNAPATGIQISGVSESGRIDIKNAIFEAFIQPLRFDPFWYRKEVVLNGLTFQNGTSFEPVLYMASPLIDLRKGRKINATLTDIKVYNNASGVIIEAFGSNGIQHNIDKFYFGDNYLPGGEAALGALHLDVADANRKDSLEVGTIAFERNFAELKETGLSVGGSSKHTVKVRGLYASRPLDLVFDQKKNGRIPMVILNQTGTLNQFGVESYVKTLNHIGDEVIITKEGSIQIKELYAADGSVISAKQTIAADSQFYAYSKGSEPVKALLTDGRLVRIPQRVIPMPIENTDSGDANPTETPQELDSAINDLPSVTLTLPTFAKKGEVIEKLGTWEVGFWGGGAAYGGGDIKHKRFKDFVTAPAFAKTMPIIRDIPVFSTLEISLGIYGQYNVNSRFSIRGTFYNSRVSMWNLSAQGLFAATRDIVTYDDNLNKVYVRGFDTWFITDLDNLELEGLWHLRPYKLQNGKESRWIPTLGLNLGAVYYNPTRYIYNNGEPGDKVNFIRRIGYLWGDHVFDPDRYDLRDLGSEGQNFLPGQKPYSSFAMTVGGSFQMTYMRKKWALKGEMKMVYTSTDYLDDFGPGLWYGGDVNKVKQYNQIDNIDARDLQRIIPANSKVGKSSPRSTDGLNDWYYQAHLGYSYFLFRK